MPRLRPPPKFPRIEKLSAFAASTAVSQPSEYPAPTSTSESAAAIATLLLVDSTTIRLGSPALSGESGSDEGDWTAARGGKKEFLDLPVHSYTADQTRTSLGEPDASDTVGSDSVRNALEIVDQVLRDLTVRTDSTDPAFVGLRKPEGATALHNLQWSAIRGWDRVYRSCSQSTR